MLLASRSCASILVVPLRHYRAPKAMHGPTATLVLHRGTPLSTCFCPCSSSAHYDGVLWCSEEHALLIPGGLSVLDCSQRMKWRLPTSFHLSNSTRGGMPMYAWYRCLRLSGGRFQDNTDGRQPPLWRARSKDSIPMKRQSSSGGSRLSPHHRLARLSLSRGSQWAQI